MTSVHLVVGDAATRTKSMVSLEQAGIGCHGAGLNDVLLLDPLGSCGMDGWSVRFQTGPRRNVAGVVLVDAPAHLPWLDPGLLDWETGRPRLVAGVLAPGLANLYVVAGGGSGRADLLVSLIRTQGALDHPVVDDLMRFVTPSHNRPAGRAARRVERRVQRRLHPISPAGAWWEAARDLEGPLSTARGT